MVDHCKDCEQQTNNLTPTESDVLQNVLYELSRLVAYCNDWLNHYHATQPIDSETFLCTLTDTLTLCRSDVRKAARKYKVRYD